MNELIYTGYGIIFGLWGAALIWAVVSLLRNRDDK